MRLRKLFSFEGRINRSQFWGIIAGLVLFTVAVWSLMSVIPSAEQNDRALRAVIVSCWMALMIWLTITTSARRFHDMGYPTLMILLWLLPFVGPLLVMGWLGCVPGTKGRNKYGREPGRRHEHED